MKQLVGFISGILCIFTLIQFTRNEFEAYPYIALAAIVLCAIMVVCFAEKEKTDVSKEKNDSMDKEK